jgi:hypothetical protein
MPIQELQRAPRIFVALLVKHEDVLIRLLKRRLSARRAAYWKNGSVRFGKYAALSGRATHGSRTE